MDETESEIDLEAEIARVRGELVAFRDVCLPAFFGRGGLPDAAYPGPGFPDIAIFLAAMPHLHLASRV